jgi:two-component system phosphate regulon sensor histidine kinase PhoR
MKIRIVFVLILMSVCVAGIAGLQWYWNYQNYQNTVRTFNHDINDALNKAVDKEIDQRHQKIITRFKSWLADTSFVLITCDNLNRHGDTQFHMRDTHPYEAGDRGTSLGFEDFKEKLSVITPAAKKAFIHHFGDVILGNDLEKGIVYYYTQRLGDSLTYIYGKTKLDTTALRQLYRRELSLKGIHAAFTLNPVNFDRHNGDRTLTVNTALRRPYKKEPVNAGFQSAGTYFIKEMKWLVITSLLLIGITLFCFGYTVKTLLSQHQLALLKDDFIDNMTHEINTPLSSIKITTEALKTFDHNPETRREYLNIISYQVEKLSALSTQLLAIGRLNRHIRGHSEVVELNGLIGKAVQDMAPQTKNMNAVIHWQPAGQEVYVKGDASALLSAFINIIDNALKYAAGAAVLNIRMTINQQYAEITFADNGMGIPQEYRRQVFDKFFRVPKGNLHNVKGYGLGLSYVKQVIDRHKGTISVAGNEPAGSIFTVKLTLDK